MKFKSSVLASASGSVGGAVFSHNRGGMYIRNRSIPTNPSSAAQSQVRAIFSGLATAWQTLTDAQRAAWRTYADNVPILDAFGDPITLTGSQMYMRLNATRERAGLAVVDDAPVVMAMDSLSLVNLAVSAADSGLTVTFEETDEWVDEDDAALLVYCGRDLSPGRSYFKGPYQLAGKIDGDSAAAPTSPDTSLTSPFAHAEGNVSGFRVVSVRADGRISPVQFRGPVPVLA